MIKAVIVGTGGIAGAHVDGLRMHPERVELVAGMDVDRDRVEVFCRDRKIPRFYTDLGTMLESERPGLLCVCSPPEFHAEQSVAGLDAGAWVLCEKPICGSLAELDRVQEAERRTGKRCASVFQMRFGSGTGHIRRLAAEGRFGRLLTGICHTLWFRDAAYYKVPWRGKWATELGGPTVGHGIHAMDHFLHLMGRWEAVLAWARALDREIEVEDVSMAMVRFAGGAMGSIVNSVLAPRQETYLRLDFQRATVELRHLYAYTNNDWTLTPTPETGADEAGAFPAIPTDVPVHHGTQIGALLDDMEAGREPLTSGQEARATIELVTAIYKSAFTGAEVVRGSILPGDPFYTSFHGGQARVPRGDE